MQSSSASHSHHTVFSSTLLPSPSKLVIKARSSIKGFGDAAEPGSSLSSSLVHADVHKVDHVEGATAYYATLNATNDCSATATSSSSANVTYKDSHSLLHTRLQLGTPSILPSSSGSAQVHEKFSKSRDFNICGPLIDPLCRPARISVASSPGKGEKVRTSSWIHHKAKVLNNEANSNRSKYCGGSDQCSSHRVEFHSFLLRACSSGRRELKERTSPKHHHPPIFWRNPIISTAQCESDSGSGENINERIVIQFLKKATSEKQRDSLKQSTTPVPSSIPLSGIQGETAIIPEAKMKEERQLEFIMKSLVAGGVAGMCAKTSVAPLDRMKILLQAHSKHYSHLGVFSGLRGIVQKESLLALYKGNGAQMVRIFPYAATQFTSFEQYKKLFGEESHIARFAAGSCAGVTAVALTYPLDTIRARLAFQVTGEHVYSGIYNCAVHIFREEGGVRALYRGFIPTVCGMIPYAGLSFYCFESFKYLCMKYAPTYTCKSHSTNTGGLVLLLYAKLICGGVAGAVAQTVSYPMDVTRRRMQLAMMDEKTKKFGMGMLSTIKLIYKENGVVRGLYRGMSINYLRAIPMVAVSFSTYELVKQMLSLDTGLPIKTG